MRAHARNELLEKDGSSQIGADGSILRRRVHHAPSATPIDVRLRRVGGEVALEVQDYGRGIAADQLPHLFTRFYQIARADRPAQGGLGLGLFICQELIAAHGGRITVVSTEGEGRGRRSRSGCPYGRAHPPHATCPPCPP